MPYFELKQVPFFSSLNEAELALVKDCLREKTFKKGEALFQEGNSCERVFFVKSGAVKMFRLSSAGREQILETLNAGDTCACNPGSEKWDCHSSAEALTTTTVWFLSREKYVQLLKNNSKLAYSLNELFAERLKCLSQLVEDVALKDSKKRLIKFLLNVLERDVNSEDGSILAVPFTREEIAQHLGVARETVVRQLYQLKSKKLIDIKSHQIIILNKVNLKKLL